MGSDLGLGTSKGIDPIALRKAKIVYNFGLSVCNWVKYETGGSLVWHKHNRAKIGVILKPFYYYLYHFPNSHI